MAVTGYYSMWKSPRKFPWNSPQRLRYGLLAAAVAIVMLLTACDSGGDAVTVGAAAPVTTSTGVSDPAKVSLRNGQFVSVTQGIETRVELLDQPRAIHDVDGDGNRDTIGFLRVRAGLVGASNAEQPAASFLSLAVLRSGDLGLTTAQVVPLSPDAVPSDIRFTQPQLHRGSRLAAQPARITADFLAPDPQNPQSLRREQVVAAFKNGQLNRVGEPVVDPTPADGAPQAATLTLGGNGSASGAGVTGYGSTAEYSLELPQRSRLQLDLNSAASGARLGVQGSDGTLLDPAEGRRSYDTTAPAGQYWITVSGNAAAPTRYDLKATASPAAAISHKVPGRATTGKVLHLTFDDGPNPPFTGEILDLLAKYHAKATFFVVGQNAARNPGWTDKELEAGNTVANHSYTHRSLKDVSQQVFDYEVDKTQQVIGPRGAKCLRPPYGYVNDQVRQRAAAKGMSVVLWDVDPKDWKRGPVPDIVHEVESHAQTGNIVIMHDGGGDRSHTVQALEIILRDLTAQGWSFQPLCG